MGTPLRIARGPRMLFVLVGLHKHVVAVYTAGPRSLFAAPLRVLPLPPSLLGADPRVALLGAEGPPLLTLAGA